MPKQPVDSVLDRLLSLVPPSNSRPARTMSEWDAAERELGVRFPGDYKAICLKYPFNQTFAGFFLPTGLYLAPGTNPESAPTLAATLRTGWEQVRTLATQLSFKHKERLGQTSGSLLPVGYTALGDQIGWKLSTREPWPIVIFPRSLLDPPEIFRGTSTEFVLRLFERPHGFRSFPEDVNYWS